METNGDDIVVNEGVSESFFTRMLRDRADERGEDDDKGVKGDDAVAVEGFFRRFFKDEAPESFFKKIRFPKNSEIADEEEKAAFSGSEDPVAESFFRRFISSRERVNGVLVEEAEKVGVRRDEPEFELVTENFFKRLLMSHKSEDGRRLSWDDGKGSGRNGERNAEEGPASSSFFKRLSLFRDRTEDHDEDGGGLKEEGFGTDVDKSSGQGEDLLQLSGKKEGLPSGESNQAVPAKPRGKNGFTALQEGVIRLPGRPKDALGRDAVALISGEPSRSRRISLVKDTLRRTSFSPVKEQSKKAGVSVVDSGSKEAATRKGSESMVGTERRQLFPDAPSVVPARLEEADNDGLNNAASFVLRGTQDEGIDSIKAERKVDEAGKEESAPRLEDGRCSERAADFQKTAAGVEIDSQETARLLSLVAQGGRDKRDGSVSEGLEKREMNGEKRGGVYMNGGCSDNEHMEATDSAVVSETVNGGVCVGDDIKNDNTVCTAGGPDMVPAPVREKLAPLHLGKGAVLTESWKPSGAKPPTPTKRGGLKSMPKHPSFKVRKGSYYGTLDVVQALCDASSGLADVFPMGDREYALRQSLAELNAHIDACCPKCGVAYPMGKGLARILAIPEEEAVLLSSREKAPFMAFVEVMKCDAPSAEPMEVATSGIPLANGDAQLPQQSWAERPMTPDLLKSSSAAIDDILVRLQQAKLKLVDVQLTVKRGRPTKSANESRRESDSSGREGGGVGGVGGGDAVVRKGSLKLRLRPDGSLNEEVESGSESGSGSEVWGKSRRGGSWSEETGDMFRRAELEDGLRQIPFGPDRMRRGSSTREMNGLHDCEGEEGRSSADSLDEELREDDDVVEVGETEEGPGVEGEAVEEEEEWVSVVLRPVPGILLDDDLEEAEARKTPSHRRVPSGVAMAEVKAATVEGPVPPGLETGTSTKEEAAAMRERAAGVMGERWAAKKERIRKLSRHGNSPDWDLRSMIVKSGDDCRQEHLAAQLIHHFHDIFGEAGLPLWLRPYEVLVTSSHTALIETIPDAISVHGIKSRGPVGMSLRDHFASKFKDGTPAFYSAQKNFVESMAGYSIFSYLMQVKDRHNGNVLLDDEGHVIHIDFGFMLGNSPGGVNFENAPFKLTREFLEVMDSDAEGTPSTSFDYFKLLCVQGFLTARKHAERIILLVDMMQNSGWPCFRGGGARTVHNLRKRFHLTLTEDQCVSLVLSLINSSLDAWRTRQYDYYQRILNGIL
eukprot:TRINITY_DN3317_c0_g1_i1.p1 TRINITY_DN3317_c0_g1~~TRINITY_DN3317_c0_g1_i1.p1  ORF type:complete len:1328 (+),score=319.25 TRINITY_DN3317_c0_g1_i1:279-3986(+)